MATHRTTWIYVTLGLACVFAGYAGSASAGGFGGPCTSGTYPKIAAYRSSTGDAILADGTSLGPVQADQDFDCIETVIDKNTDFLKDVVAHYGDGLTTIWHRGWGNIGRGELTADRTALKSDSTFTIFPGHWLFEVGTTATQTIDTLATTIYVDDNSTFAVDNDVMIHIYDSATGTHDWTSFEHVGVTSTGSDSTGDFLQVTRSDPTPKHWEVGAPTEIRLAPHALSFRGTPGGWALNLSFEGPTDSSDREGWEMYADYIEHRWTNDLCLADSCPDGILFDVGRWLPQADEFDSKVDADNDNVLDYGYVDGIQAYGLGGVQFVAELRTRYPDEIFLCDSSKIGSGYRGFADLNGVEIENFPEVNRTRATEQAYFYSGFSSSFLHLRQWVSSVTYEALSYGYTKQFTSAFECDGETPSPPTNSFFRVGLASDLMVGMPHPYNSGQASTGCNNLWEWDEYDGGTLSDWDWLGEPTTVALQVLDDLETTTDILSGISWESATSACLYGSGGSNQVSYSQYNDSSSGLPVYDLQVTAVCDVPDVSGAEIKTVETLDESPRAAGTSSYTVSFDAAATNTYDGNTAYSWVSDVPRLLRVILVLDNRELEQNMFVHADSSFTSFDVTFLDVPDLSNDRRIQGIRFQSGEETGGLRIRNPRLYRGSAERWVRYFENGVVLLNASDDAWDYDLTPFINGYSRLDGDQDSSVDDVNNGAPGSGAETLHFTVLAKDALLVRKESEPTSASTTPRLHFALERNRPNPFNPKTVFSFVIDAPGPVSLSIYDVAGRLVRTLIQTPMPAGTYTQEWDGRADNGAVVASGAYWYQLKAGNRTRTRKAVLLK